jgi:CubicO group peptidase (beta-lactamase class C family)
MKYETYLPPLLVDAEQCGTGGTFQSLFYFTFPATRRDRKMLPFCQTTGPGTSRWRSAYYLILMVISLASCGSPGQEPASRAAQVDALFSTYTKGMQPGIAVAVIRDGEIMHEGHYGYADLENTIPITSATAFRLASVSKQFSAMAVMLLEEDGKLSYDDPVSRYLPELEFYDGVTIRHLLLHTSGLPDYYDVMDTAAGMPTNRDAILLLQQMARVDFPPGERYEYSNAAYDTLGPLVEAVSGMRFAEFVRQRIFLPLGMIHSVVHDDALPQIENRAIGYEPDGNGFALNDYDALNAIIGSGGIYSTLNDLYRWDQALYGESLVSRESLEIAFTSGTNNAGEPLEYGFGWRIEDLEGHKVLRHGGSWVGFRTHILRIPDLQFCIVLLSNRADTDAEDFVDRVAAIYLAETD